MGISYAKRLTDRFSFGFQTKFIQESIWQMKAQGYAVDIGTMFVTKSNFNIGMSISNFGEKTLEEVYKALEKIGFFRKQQSGDDIVVTRSRAVSNTL